MVFQFTVLYCTPPVTLIRSNSEPLISHGHANLLQNGPSLDANIIKALLKFHVWALQRPVETPRWWCFGAWHLKSSRRPFVGCWHWLGPKVVENPTEDEGSNPYNTIKWLNCVLIRPCGSIRAVLTSCSISFFHGLLKASLVELELDGGLGWLFFLADKFVGV